MACSKEFPFRVWPLRVESGTHDGADSRDGVNGGNIDNHQYVRYGRCIDGCRYIRETVMDYFYAKAYMKERVEDAEVRRLAAETSRRESDDPRSRRWRPSLGSLFRTLTPDLGRPVEKHSLEPACCTA